MTQPYLSARLEREIRLEEGTAVRVALVPDTDDLSEIRSTAADFDVEIERTLPSGVILAAVPRESLQAFVSAPGIRAAMLQNEMEVME